MFGRIHLYLLLSASFLAAVAVAAPETLQTNVAIDKTVTTLGDKKDYKIQIDSGCQAITATHISGRYDVYILVASVPNIQDYDDYGYLSDGGFEVFTVYSTQTFYLTVESYAAGSYKIDSAPCSCPEGEELKTGTFTEIGPQCTTPASSGYNCDDQNPCSPSLTVSDKFYYPHTDPAKFVQCGQWGQCFVMSCPSTLLYNDAYQVCDFPGFK